MLDPSSDNELGLVEIKCPFRAQDAPLINLSTGKSNNFFLKHSEGQFSLKRNHDYYYQIQGQLHILKRQWCDFVVWTPRKDDYALERIHYDNNFWEEKMIPKLTKFYLSSLLPEAAAPRHTSLQLIREDFEVVLQ